MTTETIFSRLIISRCHRASSKGQKASASQLRKPVKCASARKSHQWLSKCHRGYSCIMPLPSPSSGQKFNDSQFLEASHQFEAAASFLVKPLPFSVIISFKESAKTKLSTCASVLKPAFDRYLILWDHYYFLLFTAWEKKITFSVWYRKRKEPIYMCMLEKKVIYFWGP